MAIAVLAVHTSCELLGCTAGTRPGVLYTVGTWPGVLCTAGTWPGVLYSAILDPHNSLDYKSSLDRLFTVR